MLAPDTFVACADSVVQDQLADERHQPDPLVPDLHEHKPNNTGVYWHSVYTPLSSFPARQLRPFLQQVQA